jgi:BlaR1 peptidase M56/Gram-negative bacterial TonB protein C-terminal
MLTYSLQVSLCWLVFYGLYYSLLSRETFFRLNRIYLIISLLCGLIAPFGQFFIEVKTNSQTVIMLETFVVTASAFQKNLASNTEGWLSLRVVLQVVYGLGVGVMSLRFLIGLFKIFKLYKNGKKVQNEGFITVHTCLSDRQADEVHLPFSFFNYVFINENVLEKGDIPQIMEHEQAHVSQGHSYDVILLEVLKIIFWWNPVIYFYRHSLRNIHEYLADAAVLRWVEKPVYGRLLIKQSQSGPALVLANHFIFSQLKKRIIMMTRNRSQRASLLKYVIAFPLFTVLLTLFAIPNNEIMAKTKDLSEKVNETVEATSSQNKSNKALSPAKLTLKSDTNTPLLNEQLIVQDLKKDANLFDGGLPMRQGIAQGGILIALKDTSKDDIFTVVEEAPEYQGGMPALFKWLGQNIRYPKVARENSIQGTVFVGFVVEKDGSISGIDIKKGVKGIIRDTLVVVGFSETNGVKGTKIVEREDHSIDNEAKRVIAAMPKWKPGRDKGVPVRVAYTLPIKFKLE